MTDTVETEPKVALVVKKYIELRDKKAEMKAAFTASVATIDTAMERIETFLMTTLNQAGGSSLTTPYGTPYIAVQTSATVADWPSTLAWVKQNDQWDMLTRGVSKTHVEAFKLEHNDLPPGLNWTERRVVNVRRS